MKKILVVFSAVVLFMACNDGPSNVEIRIVRPFPNEEFPYGSLVHYNCTISCDGNIDGMNMYIFNLRTLDTIHYDINNIPMKEYIVNGSFTNVHDDTVTYRLLLQAREYGKIIKSDSVDFVLLGS